MDKHLKDLVTDWNGFEKLVEDMHKDGKITVEHDVTLTGASGATRQIDVLVTEDKGSEKQLTLIECKYWNYNVGRTEADIMFASLDDLNASRGVIFTTKGYQKGAKAYAKAKNIDIYVVRSLSDGNYSAQIPKSSIRF